ncbi:5856_t:CDS:2, partial [Entrophospora sp. SA101]
PNVELVNEQAECQKVIGVSICHAHMSTSCNSSDNLTKTDIGEKTLPEIEVSTQETSTSSSTPSIQKSHTSSHSMTASGNSEDIIGECNKSSGLKKVSEVEVSEVSTSLPETETINISNKSRPSISVLPDDPKEKQKHVIKMVLEKAPNLSLKYSSGDNDYFDCSITCPLCNNNHKNENIKNYIKDSNSESIELISGATHLSPEAISVIITVEGSANALPNLAKKYNVSYAQIREIWEFAIAINN